MLRKKNIANLKIKKSKCVISRTVPALAPPKRQNLPKSLTHEGKANFV